MARERGPNDFVEDARNHGDFDRLPDYAIERRRGKPQASWLTTVGLVASLIIQVGALAWYGGRLEQRVTSAETANERQDRDNQRLADSIREIAAENNRQAQTIAGTNASYLDIVRRLQSIEEKLDHRR